MLGSTPVDFEMWVSMAWISLEPRHIQLVSWQDAAYAAAKASYERCLASSPLQRSDIRPTIATCNATNHHVEKHMRRYVVALAGEQRVRR